MITRIISSLNQSPGITCQKTNLLWLQFKIANIYYGLDKLVEAYDHGKKALAKGGLDNEGAAQMFVAYMGYELKKYDEALPYAEAAKNAGASNADRLFEAIQNAINERQAALEATI